VHRSELKGASYNPRVMSDKARVKLKANLKRVGLVEPPVWNERTGHVVGGHQRLSILDALEGNADYTLRVAVVDLDERTEREMNVFLNNGEAQGDWDLEKLESLFNDGVDWEHAGFDTNDVVRLLGNLPGTQAQSAERLEHLAEQMEAAQQYHRAIEQAAIEGEDDEDFYLVLTARSDAHCDRVMELFGLPDNRFQDIRLLERLHALLVQLGASPETIRRAAAGAFDSA
jgi:hypothetical protein